MKNKHFRWGYAMALLSMLCVMGGTNVSGFSGPILLGLATFWGILGIGHFIKAAHEGENF